MSSNIREEKCFMCGNWFAIYPGYGVYCKSCKNKDGLMAKMKKIECIGKNIERMSGKKIRCSGL